MPKVSGKATRSRHEPTPSPTDGPPLPAAPKKVVDWLLEPEQPAVRYRTLTRLLGKPESDREVREARVEVTERGWAAEILAAQRPDGTWVGDRSLYTPKYLSTNWQLLVLADLGVPRTHPGVARATDLWIRRMGSADGGFGTSGGKRGHLCTTGNSTRALIQFGFTDEPIVARGLDWLVTNASPLGGWSCFGSGRNLDSWEGLSAFAEYPRERWSPTMTEVVAKASEFFLQRELYRQGEPYAPWYRFHYPNHYYYDLLVGLDLLTSLGYGADPRLNHALAHLVSRRRSDGRWTLDAAHPDAEGGVAEWFAAHPNERPIPLELEKVGAPSKMITLRALVVLDRARRARTDRRA